jgi:hypothetical protein
MASKKTIQADRAAKATKTKAGKAVKATEVDTTAVPAPTPALTATETAMGKLSALDAAARVMAEAGTPMSCKEMIGAMAAKGYWTSPKGQTPHATLYAAITREILVRGDSSRFVKTGRGTFTLKGMV